MDRVNFVVCYLALCGYYTAITGHADRVDIHHLIKRQVQTGGSQVRQYTSSPSRHFVSPDGEPYYEYQPPVSSSRGVSQGRSATSHVRIGGAQSGGQATSQVKVGGLPSERPATNVGGSRPNPPAYNGSRSRTYKYPFGREQVQYAGAQPQEYGDQNDRSIGGRNETSSQQEAILRQDRQNSVNRLSNQRSSVNYQNDLSQVPSSQQPSHETSALQEQELRRRQDELRRRHEDERRRQMEERQRLIEDRKRQEEERRRLYYERLNQHQSRGTENNQDLRTNVTRSQQSGLSNNRRQQSNNTVYPQQREASLDSSNQQSTPRTATNYQDGQLPIYQRARTSNSSQQARGSSPQSQQPVYNSHQRTSSSQQPTYTTNNTHYQGSYNIPSQRQGTSQVYSQQPVQVDPRISGFRSSSEQASQGQRYPYGTNFGSSFSYEPQDSDLDCPETGIDLRINGLDCQQAVQQFGGYLCYTHEYTSRDCCNVCKPRKQPSRTGCEYGDHAELCTSIAPSDCYDLRNRYSCCETCERLRRNNLPVGCEYGDMTIRCENVRQNPGLCYIPDNQRLCCETCNQIRNVTNAGCPWGDYNSNLCQMFDENTSNVRINCYSQQRRRLCCQSCERLKEWMPKELPADCQYGDRPVIFTTSQFGRLNCSSLFSYFSVDECRTNEAVAVNCCHTCHRILNSRG